MFLAAISLWTKDLRARQARPSTTCLQNWSSKLGRSGLDSSDGLEGGGEGEEEGEEGLENETNVHVMYVQFLLTCFSES